MLLPVRASSQRPRCYSPVIHRHCAPVLSPVRSPPGSNAPPNSIQNSIHGVQPYPQWWTQTSPQRHANCHTAALTHGKDTPSNRSEHGTACTMGRWCILLWHLPRGGPGLQLRPGLPVDQRTRRKRGTCAQGSGLVKGSDKLATTAGANGMDRTDLRRKCINADQTCPARAAEISTMQSRSQPIGTCPRDPRGW